MTKDTLRDQIWGVMHEMIETIESGDEVSREWILEDTDKSLDVINNGPDPKGYFTKHDVAQQVDTSKRTIHDVLETAESYGILQSTKKITTLPADNYSGYKYRRNVRGYRPAGMDKPATPDRPGTDIPDADDGEIEELKDKITGDHQPDG